MCWLISVIGGHVDQRSTRGGGHGEGGGLGVLYLCNCYRTSSSGEFLIKRPVPLSRCLLAIVSLCSNSFRRLARKLKLSRRRNPPCERASDKGSMGHPPRPLYALPLIHWMPPTLGQGHRCSNHVLRGCGGGVSMTVKCVSPVDSLLMDSPSILPCILSRGG